LASIPRLDQDNSRRLLSITGLPPDLSNPPAGCRFAARCSRATDKCRTDEPALTGDTLGHLFACWHAADGPLPTPAGKGQGGADRAGTEPGGQASGTGAAGEAAAPGQPLLEITDLVKEYPVTHGIMQRRLGSVHAVSGVSFTVNPGETFGLVGESGCG